MNVDKLMAQPLVSSALVDIVEYERRAQVVTNKGDPKKERFSYYTLADRARKRLGRAIQFYSEVS